MSSIARTLGTVSDPAWVSLLWMERTIRAILLFGVLISVIYVVGMPGDVTGRLVSNLVFTVVSAGAAVVCFWSARRLGIDGRPWRFFGFGCLSWFAAIHLSNAASLANPLIRFGSGTTGAMARTLR